jgi:LAS superfamily LD-carboxypeptidase LdcB
MLKQTFISKKKQNNKNTTKKRTKKKITNKYIYVKKFFFQDVPTTFNPLVLISSINIYSAKPSALDFLGNNFPLPA